MYTYCFIPIGHEADEIIIHAVNREAANAKLEDYVADPRLWTLANGFS